LLKKSYNFFQKLFGGIELRLTFAPALIERGTMRGLRWGDEGYGKVVLRMICSEIFFEKKFSKDLVEIKSCVPLQPQKRETERERLSG
jgi:hypothetical protein